MPKQKLEICCYTVESALLAEEAGADRIELCDNFPEGGTTPSFAAIEMAVQKLTIPVNVIVRPRGGDFLYSETEFEIIKRDVAKIAELNVNGIVVGFLNADGTIDTERTATIVEMAKPMEVTFHRAFDMCRDPFQALGQLKSIGIKRILTSGGKNKAAKGLELLAELVKKAGEDIIIMPGSGVNHKNIESILEQTRAVEFHSSAKTFLKSKMRCFNDAIDMGGNGNGDEYSIISVDTEMISKMATAIK